MTNVQKENTATWVDQRYGALLARLSRKTLDVSLNDLRSSIRSKGRIANRIASFRTYDGWLVETPLKKVGFGVDRPGIRLWALSGDTDDSHIGISICSLDFDRHGRIIRGSDYCHALVTYHAMTRLFERLRTNALGEVIKIGLVPLTTLLPPSEIGIEKTIHISGVGRFEAISDEDRIRSEKIIWVIKTFIPD